MLASRRSFLAGAAGLSAAVLTPDMVLAAQSMAAVDWSPVTADLDGDIAAHAMRRIHGRAPRGLEGALYRNGPARFRRPGGSARHWFDGDGLVRRFRLADGEAELAARFVDTPKRRQEGRLGAMVMPGFGTPADPRAEIGSADDANAANTSVMAVGDALWALWEAGSPTALDPATLETRGFVSLRPDLKGMPFLAHPRVEPGGRIWNLGMSDGRAAVWRLAADGALEDLRVIDLPRASYVHDFTATERSLVIVLQPWVRTRQVAPFSAGFDWLGAEATLVLVLDKADLSARRVFEVPAFGFFHLGDAWEEADGTIRFDVCAHPDMRFAADGAREMLNGVPLGGEPARLALAALHPDGRGELQRSEVVGEFPRSDPRLAGQARSLTVHVTGETPGRPFASGVAVQDWRSGRSRAFDFGPGHVVDEMVVVPKPGAGGEADAWLVGPSINLRDRTTELHVLDLARIEDGPVVSWASQTVLPAGFHGTWKG
jgi:carotenoid cleavage dioxygenase-like enzyme